MNFSVSAEETKISFFAAKHVEANDELVFDYGPEFWEGRSGAKPKNDDRDYTTYQDLLGVPMSTGALKDLLRRRAPLSEKRAALMRALDYFGVDRYNIPVKKKSFLFFWRRKNPISFITYPDASLRQLANALRYQFMLADLEDDEDDENDDQGLSSDR